VELLNRSEVYRGLTYGYEHVESSYPLAGTKARVFMSTAGIELRWQNGDETMAKLFTLLELKTWQYNAAGTDFSFETADGNQTVTLKTANVSKAPSMASKIASIFGLTSLAVIA
jgi:hypothetical protein